MRRKLVPRSLYPQELQRTREPFGHTYHAPKPCADCGVSVPDNRGMERGGVKRCGPCDIKFCDACDKRRH